jgi:hypothetical protein
MLFGMLGAIIAALTALIQDLRTRVTALEAV